MIKKDVIEEVKKRLVKVYDPLEIYVFGSYAWGKPTEDSDLDLCVVVEDSIESRYKRPISGYDVLFGLKIPKDIVVYTKEEFEKYSGDISNFTYKIRKAGKKIYAKA